MEPNNQKTETLQRYQTSLVHELSNLVITGNPFSVLLGASSTAEPFLGLCGWSLVDGFCFGKQMYSYAFL